MSSQESNLEALFSLESQRTGIVEEPPFKILVLGDLSGDAEKPEVATRRLSEIDRDDFDAVMAKYAVRLDLDITGVGNLSLEFNELEDFHPDQIFRKVSLFTDLRDLRKRLRDPETFNAAAREVRARFDSGETADESAVDRPPLPSDNSEPASGDLLDAILSKPSGGGDAPKASSTTPRDITELVNSLVRPHIVNVDEDEQQQMLAAVDEATSSLMRSILHHPRFQRLEATWRGLFFLVRRVETSTELKIYVLDASKEDLLSDLASSGSLADTTLYKHLIRDAIDTPGEEPFAVVLGDLDFDVKVADVAGLIRIGKIVSAANLPFVSAIAPSFLGIDAIAESPDPAAWAKSESSEAWKLWATLTTQPESAHIGMVIPRFLTRLPYGHDTEPLDTFAFEEFIDGPFNSGYVWSNSCYVVGTLLAQSFSEYGWEMGRALKQDVEGLPIHVYKQGTETVYSSGSEVLLTQIACERLMDLGLMPLVTFKNTDRVKLARFQSVSDTALQGMWVL